MKLAAPTIVESSMRRRQFVVLALPTLLSCLGCVWMSVAVDHFEKQTGRSFYGLAGQHYSEPKWAFEYYEGGEHVERWTVSVPANIVFSALIASAVLLGVLHRSHGVKHIAFICVWHTGVVACTCAVAAWYWLNVMGVLI